jgi:hypothetical protein
MDNGDSGGQGGAGDGDTIKKFPWQQPKLLGTPQASLQPKLVTLVITTNNSEKLAPSVWAAMFRDEWGTSTANLASKSNAPNLQSVIDTILAQNDQSVRWLILGGHGAGAGISFRDFAAQPNVNARGLATLPAGTLDAVKGKLSPNCAVILYGCTTGNDFEGLSRMAKQLRRPVYGNTGDITPVYHEFWGYYIGFARDPKGKWLRADPNGIVTDVGTGKVLYQPPPGR